LRPDFSPCCRERVTIRLGLMSPRYRAGIRPAWFDHSPDLTVSSTLYRPAADTRAIGSIGKRCCVLSSFPFWYQAQVIQFLHFLWIKLEVLEPAFPFYTGGFFSGDFFFPGASTCSTGRKKRYTKAVLREWMGVQTRPCVAGNLTGVFSLCPAVSCFLFFLPYLLFGTPF